MNTRRRPKRPSSHWLGRLVRGRGFDRNPLRRKSDRAETALLALLLAAFLAAAPFAGHAAGSRVYAIAARHAQAQQASAHRVPATLLQAAPSWSDYGQGPPPGVAARWRAPDGKVRTGQVFPPSGAAAGSAVMVWTDQAGQLTDPPLRHTQVVNQADLAAVGAIGFLAITLTVASWLIRRSLDRRRLAAWDADWLAHGPRWSPRR